MSRTALEARVSAFGAYVGEVTEVATLLGQAEAAHRLMAQLLIDEPAMTMAAVVQEQAAADVERMRQELLIFRGDLGLWPGHSGANWPTQVSGEADHQ